MRFASWLALPFLFPVMVSASPVVACSLAQNGREAVIAIHAESDALGGVWETFGPFKVRAVLAAPGDRRPWLLMEVHAEAAGGDDRIVSSQKVFAPFATGRMEVVEPKLGRSLIYECPETK